MSGAAFILRAPMVGTSSGIVLAANAERSYVKLINDSDAVIYLKVGAAAHESQRNLTIKLTGCDDRSCPCGVNG